MIYVFLSGGLSQLDSFDLKPDAPENVRGEFRPTATRTPGLQICEHLPRLAERSARWSLVRSMYHPRPEHSAGHMIMLSGQTELPPGFDPNRPRPGDWPSIAALANWLAPPRAELPSAVCLPERLVHHTGRVIPGQFAGMLGGAREPMFLDLCPYNAQSYGAYPTYCFHHAKGPVAAPTVNFSPPSLELSSAMPGERLASRAALLSTLSRARQPSGSAAAEFLRHRQRAVGLLSSPSVRRAFDIRGAEPELVERYGQNTFGWSLLLARQLVEAGVNLVQVHLGNDESWDTHERAFPNLRDYLLPPTDRAVAALLDDLGSRGLLDSTLVVMAGEMGRTPKLSTLPGATYAGRDHWGTQTVWLAGGGVQGGRVLGATDKIGAYPANDPQRPENLAATIYHVLGIPRTAQWSDTSGRPHAVYQAEPFSQLL